MSAGYGQDMSCASALVTGRTVTGKRLLAEAAFRRLTTPRGTLYGGDVESTYGLDLSAYVGAVGDTVSAAALPGVIESELLKDDRFERVIVDVTRDETIGRLVTFAVRIRIVPTVDVEDFEFTLAVSAVSVAVIGELP